MSSTKSFQPLEAAKTAAKRLHYWGRSRATFGHNFIRDQLTLRTWLALGAAAQMAVFALPIKSYYAAAPVIVYLIWEIVGTLLIILGIRPDPEKAKMLETKYTALVPTEDGEFKMGTQGNKISILLLGFRAHHHLGMFAPGGKEIGDRAAAMFQDLEARADEVGLLGISQYNNAASTKKNAEIVTIMYFKSNADAVRYATSPLHREAWDWYNRVVKQYPHLGIWHELFEAPAGSWETVYKNTEPTGFATSKHKVVDKEGNEQWISPIVDATRGKTATTAGRVA